MEQYGTENGNISHNSPTTDRRLRRLASSLCYSISKTFPLKSNTPRWYLSGSAASKCLNDANIEVELGNALHTTLKRSHKLRVTARHTFPQGEVIATVPLMHHALAALYASINTTNLENVGAPAQVEPFQCGCGTVHVRLRALKQTLANQPLYVPGTPFLEAGTSLSQFDGSHLPDINVGGAGIVVWERDSTPHPVYVQAEPIMKCEDSLHVEIVSAHRALIEGLRV